jgi:hypothetical protein
MSKFRSDCNLRFASVFGLFLTSNGSSRQIVDALYQCGLSISFSSTLNLQDKLAEHCLARAVCVARGPHALGYDHINISTLIFVEQRTSGPQKVQSGTFGVLYELQNAAKDAM